MSPWRSRKHRTQSRKSKNLALKIVLDSKRKNPGVSQMPLFARGVNVHLGPLFPIVKCSVPLMHQLSLKRLRLQTVHSLWTPAQLDQHPCRLETKDIFYISLSFYPQTMLIHHLGFWLAKQSGSGQGNIIFPGKLFPCSTHYLAGYISRSSTVRPKCMI